MEVKLKKRLLEIAKLVPPCKIVADLGCDHGLLPIYLVLNDFAKGALATDVGKGPLARASENIRDFGLLDRIETRLSDGFENISPGEAEVFVIAGMGGILMKKILEKGRPVWKDAKAVILSPHRDEMLIREYMSEFCYWDTDVSICEDEKYYTAMRFLPGKPKRTHTKEELILGLNPSPEYIRHFIEKNEKILLSLKSGEESKDLLNKKEDIERLIRLAKNYEG